MPNCVLISYVTESLALETKRTVQVGVLPRNGAYMDSVKKYFHYDCYQSNKNAADIINAQKWNLTPEWGNLTWRIKNIITSSENKDLCELYICLCYVIHGHLLPPSYLLVFPSLLQFCIGTIKDDFLGVISDPGANAWYAALLSYLVSLCSSGKL